jgi:autotransporter-associated beta strand protein
MNYSTQRTRSRLALTAAATIAAAALWPFAAGGADVTRTWDGTDTANNFNLANASNWVGDTRPTFTGNTDSIVFNGDGTGTIILNRPSGIVPPTGFIMKSLTFTGGSYTFSGQNNNNANSITFGDATASANNTGNLTNQSTSTQSFTPNNVNSASSIRLSFGTVNAQNGAFSFGGNTILDIGAGSADAGRNVTFTGAFNTTVGGILLGAGTDTSAGGAITKDGTGQLLLNGNSSTWNGRITVNDGVLRANNNGSLGSAAGRTTIAGGAGTGRLDITSATGIALAEPLYLGGRTAAGAAHVRNIAGNNTLSGPLTLDAGGTEFGFTSDAGKLTVSGSVAYGSASGATTLRVGGAGDGAIAGVIGAGGSAISVVKEGAGTWSLDAANAYTGTTTVSAGRLNVTTAQAGSGAAAAADGATLGVRVAAVGQSLNVPSLTLGASAGGTTFAVDLNGNASQTTAVVTAPSFSVNGPTTVVVSGGGLSVGVFPLVDYDGAIGGTAGSFTLGALPARVQAQLLDDPSGTRLVLDVQAFDVPKWTGATTADWDIDDGTGTGTLNWHAASSATRYLQGAGGTDAVIFDDTATAPGATSVNLTAALTPASVTVDATTNQYTFVGTGKLSGATPLTKKGAGTLTLANAGGNDFTGTTAIEAGTLKIGDGVTPGAGQFGTGPVVNNAAIVLDRPDAFTTSNPISGAGTITKQGLEVATLSGNSTFTGAVTVSAGTLKLGNANALGSSSGGTTVADGATLDFGGQSVPAGEVITVSGAGLFGTGALLNSGTGNSNVGPKNVVFAAPTTFGGTARFDIRNNTGGLDAAGHALTKIGGSTVVLANIGETHLGDVILTAGNLTFEGDTTFGDQPGTIQVGPSGELAFEASTVTHTKAITAGGGFIRATGGTGNTIAGPITLSADTSFTSINAAQLTVTGSISGAGKLKKEVAGTVVLAGANDYFETEVLNGTLRIGNDGSTGTPGTGPIALNPLAAGNTTTLQFRRSDTALVVPNTISSGPIGTNVVAVGAAGTTPAAAVVTLSGLNTFTGAVNVNAGSLRITNSSALGVGPKTVSVATSGKPSLRLDGSAGAINLASNLGLTTSNDDATYPAIVNEAGDNVINGLVTANSGGGGGTRVWVQAGTLELAGGVTVAGAASKILFLDGPANGTVSGVIANGSQPLSVTKEGDGTWTLTGANTYTGNTVVRGGALVVGATSAIGGNVVNVTAGTLDVSALSGGLSIGTGRTLRGSGTVVGVTSVASGGTVAPGDGTATPTTIGTLTAGAFSLAGGTTLSIDFGDDDAGPGIGLDALLTTAPFTVAADALSPVTVALTSRDAFGVAGAAADFDPLVANSWVFATAASFDGPVTASQFAVDPAAFVGSTDPAAWSVSVGSNTLSLNYAPVPEPAAAVSLALGAAALLGGRRRRARR